jgi:hypothetical protein
MRGQYGGSGPPRLRWRGLRSVRTYRLDHYRHRTANFEEKVVLKRENVIRPPTRCQLQSDRLIGRASTDILRLV